jgi:hypothetical protein
MNEGFDLMAGVIFKVLIGILLCAFGFVLFILLLSIFSEKFALVKSEWQCTQQHNERVMTMAGKVPMMTTRTVCDRYERIR